MRVTRYVNGTKTEKAEMSKMFVKNELISSTIDIVNRRLHSCLKSMKGEDSAVNE